MRIAMHPPPNRRSHRRTSDLQACVFAATLATACGALPAQRATSAHYTIHAMGAAAEQGVIPLLVVLRIDSPAGERSEFEIPVWTPGSYRLRDFPERVELLSARAGERELPVRRLDADSWSVRHGATDAVEVRYRVLLRPDDRFMDPAPARRCITYEGPQVYLYLRGQLGIPCHVRFDLPDGWTAESGLEARADGSHFAPDYDTLADCPVKLGIVQKFAFEALGKQVDVVLDGGMDLQFDHQPWLAGLQAIVEQGGAVFGELPFSRYVFLFTASATGGGGGLEHLNSTTIGLARTRFTRNPASSFGIVAHEFFHCWNVKRLRPAELGPFAYDRPNRTSGLWLSEGVTSYYAEVLQARAGMKAADEFWRSMAGAIAGWESSHGRAYTSVEQASLRVWDKQPSDRTVDYYGAGEVLGLLLDLQIRAASSNARCLDDAMLAMWLQCERLGRGLGSDDIEAICSQVAGVDLGEFFAGCVRGTVVPDYEALLALAGMQAKRNESSEPVLRGLNLVRRDQPAFSDLAAVERSGGGDPIGLSGVLRQLDDQPVTDADGATSLVRAAAAAGRTRMRVEYELPTGARRTVLAPIEQRTRVRVELQPIADAPPAAVAIRDGITARRTLPAKDRTGR